MGIDLKIKKIEGQVGTSQPGGGVLATRNDAA
jgi:hypothetical protein